MPAGKLRHRVTLQERDPTAPSNAYNERGEAWRELMEEQPAEVIAFAGREYVAAQTLLASVTHRVQIRTPTRLVVLPIHRFVWIEQLLGGPVVTHYLDIKQVAPLVSRRGYTECICTEHLNG